MSKPKRSPKSPPLIFVHMLSTKKLATDIRVPTTRQEADLLCEAAAGLLVKLAIQIPETEFGCHGGCVFAGIIEMAHRKMNEALPVEYERVVKGGLLTPSAAAYGGGH